MEIDLKSIFMLAKLTSD